MTLEDVCDETLEPFKTKRLVTDKVSLTTVNKSFEVVRQILNLAGKAVASPEPIDLARNFAAPHHREEW